MNEYLTSASLKSLAKGQLLGKYGTLAGVVFIHLGYMLFVFFCSNLLIDTTSVLGYLIYYAVSFVFTLLEGLLIYGEAYIFLKLACGQPVAVGDLFYGLSNNPDKVLKVQAVFTVIQMVCSIPNMMRIPQNQPLVLLFYVILVLAVNIIYIVLTLMLSQSFFLMLDFPEKSGKETLKLCWRLMKGNRKRLFLLELSFLPLMLLCLLSFGIGFLWLEPFMQMTYTYFFLDLMNPA